MVDMEGIDILFRYGDIIPGLYQKLVESIAQCRYQCLYNWYFDGLLIPPAYVEMTVIDNKVWIEDGVCVDEEDTLGFLAPGLKSVTGAVAYISDALARKADQIACYINPEQNLHGYIKPWPAGGGKNLYATPAVTSTSYGVELAPNEDGSVTLSGQANSIAALFYSSVDIPSGTTVTISLNNTAVNSEVGVRLLSTPTAGSGTQYGTMVSADELNKKYTLTTSFNAKSINVFVKTNHGPVNSITLKIMVEYGSTASPFEPHANICPIVGYTGLNVYRESSYDTEANPIVTVNWQDDVGTVYGGTLDVVTGLLTVDRESFILNGSTSISTISELTNVLRFWIFTNSKFNFVGSAQKMKCDRLTFDPIYINDSPSFSFYDLYPSSLVIKLPIGTCEATAVGIKAYLSANPIQIVLPLAAPVEYHLTPQEVTMLLGNNVIWHNANGDTSVTYWHNKF